MSPHQSWPPFDLGHCMAEGQVTPPSSPLFLPLEKGSCLQLSKLLRRPRALKWKSDSSQKMSGALTAQSSLTKMKSPFPLLLPDSPSLTGRSSPATTSPPGLHRMSASYNDLRTLAQRHGVLNAGTALLPSPLAKDSQDDTRSYFKFYNPRDRTSISDNESLDSLQILSYYYDDDNETRDRPIHVPLDECSDHEQQINDDNQSTTSESMPATPLDQEYRATFCSEESDWLANTTSYEERGRRFKARCYQVVQHPWTDVHKQHGEDEVVSLC